MTPGEGSQQDCNTNILAGTTAAMGVLNIIFIAVIVVLVVALVKRGKRQVSDSAVYYDVQKSSKVEMKDNKENGHSTMRVAETVPGCKAEYEEVGRVQVSGGNQGGGIKMKKNEAYAQPGGNNTHWMNHAPEVIYSFHQQHKLDCIPCSDITSHAFCCVA